ncbi:dUTPase [Pseudidiomarina woesei]|uniref:dUTPase n=1 Tax=Pseudidiomarina woesei TaxID=1381080 RepID=A0A0K6H8Y5_9GAMM|nr:dUTPase [Pseudidiomarina woesei]CUA87359.1 dUTPase [Pseudidiomarina woesei]
MTPEQARQLVDMQIAFNQVIDPSYPENPQVKRDDIKAILVELGEYFEHTAYKWWKKQTADWAQANMELIDILHFAISDAIENAYVEQHQAPADAVAQLIFNGAAANQTITDGKELVAALAQDGTPAKPLQCGAVFFNKLMAALVDAYGDANTVYLTYVGKNALNNLRQQRGYKQGTYIKMWQGREDNEVMMALLSEHESKVIAAEQPLAYAQALLLTHYDEHIDVTTA